MRVLVLNAPFHKKFSRPQRSPAVTKSGTIYFPLWLAYCAGVLEEDGFEVTLIDAPARDLTLEQVLTTIKELSPRLVVMDVATPSLINDLAAAEAVKKLVSQSFVVLVGTHVSALARETLSMSLSIDAVARREYEFTVRDLARILRKVHGRPSDSDLRSIQGLSFTSLSGKVIQNPDRSFIKDLDQLPWVSRVYLRHLKITDYFNPNALYPMVTMITSRGCPYRCSFCVYPQTLTGRAYRFRSIIDVVNEMEYITTSFPGVRSIFFEDDTLTAHKKRCLALSSEIEDRGLSITWTANSRVDLDLETMLSMRRAGCRMLCVGFESGDQQVLNAMHKGISRERMIRFMNDAKRAGLLIHGCFIFGFPGETKNSIKNTIDFALQLNPDTAQFYPVMIYPGTEAYEEYRDKGWITSDDFSDWLTSRGLHNCVIRNQDLEASDLVRLCDEARRKFYLRPGYIVGKLGQIVSDPAEFKRTFKAGRTFLKHLITGSRV